MRVALVGIPLLAVVIGSVAAAAPKLPAPGSAAQIAKLVAASASITTVTPTVANEIPKAANDNPASTTPDEEWVPGTQHVRLRRQEVGEEARDHG